jgi:uncharacterized protein YkwD
MFNQKSIQKVLILTVWMLLIGLVVIKPANANLNIATSDSVVKEDVASPYSEQQIIEVTNSVREALDLHPLLNDEKLSQAAQAKAEDMVKYKYFGHFAPTGEMFSAFIDRSGYMYRQAGENVAMQHTTIDSLMNAWLLSPSHKANIVNANYNDIGVGVAYGTVGEREGWFVVQLFGTKR